MRFFISCIILLASLCVQADTIDHYMNISDNIPKMEMKADPQSQAWARSARNVLTITSETVAETLMQANDLARSQGKPLFCLPPGVSLNAVTLDGIILQTYRDNSSQQSDKDKMTVSQIAWQGVMKAYPCDNNYNSQNAAQELQHVAALMGR